MPLGLMPDLFPTSLPALMHTEGNTWSTKHGMNRVILNAEKPQ